MKTDPMPSMPYCDEMEKGMLSCFFARPADDLPDFMATMPPETFYHAANRLFYDSLCAMHMAGKPIEVTSALDYLTDAGLLDRIGGPGVLAEVAVTHMAPSIYPYYKGILRDKLLLRRMLAAADEAILTIQSHDPHAPAEATLNLVEQSFVEVREWIDTSGQQQSWAKVLDRAEERFEETIRTGGGLPGISTGYPHLDEATGGMRPGQIWTVGGGTSDGKSALVQNIIAHLCGARVPTCLYTLEMTCDENADRFFAIQTGVPAREFHRGLSKEHYQAYVQAKQEMLKWPLHVRDTCGIKLAALRADMRLMARRHQIKVFIIDYLQLICPDHKGHTREREVAEISCALKTDAKMLGATILSLSQLNEHGALRESRAIGQDSDVVAMIDVPVSKTGESFEHRRVITLEKVRSGERGTKVDFKFQGATFRFTETGARPLKKESE